jgi:hypothetical protein
MTEFAVLEIGFHRRDADSYAVEFRFSQPNSDADVRIGQDQPAPAVLNLDALSQLAHDPVAYGEELTRSLFAETIVQSAFAQARASVQSLQVPLRVRLMIDSSATELHALHWETLRDPQDGSALFTGDNLLFSRYLSSTDWRPVRLRAKGELRALVVAANPSDLPDYNLAPIEVQEEVKRAKQALERIPVTVLPKPDSDQRSTMNNLVDQLRVGQYDILYLVCHGALLKDEPWLWLENDQGRVARASGTELVTRLKELQELPRLVVLASCESAGSGDGEALAALGPRLSSTGVPAVLAMQGQISMETAAEFMAAFFRELQRDGQIDRAVAVARGTVRQRADHWMPALFMRLKSGRIWYVAGFTDEQDEFEKWQSLVGFVRDKTSTPILGPGLTDSILGSRREIALRWAEKHGFPMAPQDRDVLPRVSQYLITHQSPAYLPVAVREATRDEILRRYEAEIPADLKDKRAWSYTDIGHVFDLLTGKNWEGPSDSPYRMLAQLRLPIYITTDITGFMRPALIEAGAEPVVRLCPWNKWIPKDQVIYEETPTPERPLVYHLFGHLNVPNSLVMAEDRYFDYLIGVTLNKSLIPSAVRAALNSTSLFFLGFQMDDWEFRVFFRFLMAQEGRDMLKFYSHAAAQIEPEEDRILDLERARKYLEEYYESENISIYWGNSEEFLRDLCRHMEGE